MKKAKHCNVRHFFIKEVYSDTLTELLKDLTHPVSKENVKYFIYISNVKIEIELRQGKIKNKIH